MESRPTHAHRHRSVTISTTLPTVDQDPTTPTTPPPPPPPTQRTIYFRIGRKTEVAKFWSNTSNDQIRELFRSAAEASSSDILKLYDVDGHLLNVDNELLSNTAHTKYSLEVVAAHTNSLLLNEVGVDLRALETRVATLERHVCAEQLHNPDWLPPTLDELQRQVDRFRHKLETTEHLSWLGFYKQLPEPISSEACRRLQYRRKSDTVKRRVKERYFQICDTEVSERVRHWIRMPTFDSRPWEDEEVLLMLQQMFLDLNLCSKFGIELHTLTTFIFEVYKNYNDVPFHNFRHSFCVAQMMYTMIWACNLQERLGDLELLILLVSCICHDLDHPGFNNIYQINARTELAIRYNDISPLENHHCSVAFRILEHEECNIFKNFSSDTFKLVREGMIRCILATDMARHNEILGQFKDITPEFDYGNKAHCNLLSMVLIKVADISNEARPMDVAEPWLDRLLTEFFKQSDAEKMEGLPITPFMDREKITKPSSQCSFIGFVLLPLFEALGDLLTELQDLIVQPVRDALDYYRRLNEATKEERLHRKSVVAELLEHPALARSSVGCYGSKDHQFLQHPNSPTTDDNSSESDINVPKSVSNHSVRSRKSISFRSRSRSTDDENDEAGTSAQDKASGAGDDDNIASPNLADLIEDSESGGDDSETATEVEVSEKTLKFKISTESNLTSSSTSTGRKSYPGSRKGSREKSQQLTCSEVARAVQREKDRGNRGTFASALSFDSRSIGKRLSVDMNESIEVLRRFHGRSFDRGRCGIISPTGSSAKSVDFVEDDEYRFRNGNVRKASLLSPSSASSSTKPCTTQVVVTAEVANIQDDNHKSDEKIEKITSEGCCVSPPQDNLEEIRILCSESSKEPSKIIHRSLFSRLRQFTADKLNLETKSGATSAPGVTKKASTLPKASKQKGWKLILTTEKAVVSSLSKLDNQTATSSHAERHDMDNI